MEIKITEIDECSLYTGCLKFLCKLKQLCGSYYSQISELRALEEDKILNTLAQYIFEECSKESTNDGIEIKKFNSKDFHLGDNFILKIDPFKNDIELIYNGNCIFKNGTWNNSEINNNHLKTYNRIKEIITQYYI